MNPLAALGYVVFERAPDGSFQLSGAAPDWLPSGCLTEAFPFLEVFLPDAEEFWASPGDRPVLHSDLWTQNGASGTELHFCAIAIAGEQQFLLIERAEQRFQQAQSFIQYAHEASLAREQIAKLTQAKSEFLARMSHEIRTPMHALLGMAELLAETPLNDEQREYVRVFRRAGDNLLNVINDILDFSKVEAGQIELENIEFDLTEVLAEALEIAGVRARSKGLGLSSRIQPGVPTRLIGDPGRLRQILLNLLGNATKFTDRGDLAVLVEMNPDQPAPGALHFAVSDTGIGIPTDRLASIFESFSQADVSTTRNYGGTGLGLAISKRFVELMGGRIWAESVLGAGSTMHFTAQFSVASAGAPQPVAERGAAAILRNRGLRILLADDSPENRFLIRGYLKDSGCIVDEVENGAQAVERFKQRAYDIVLMDAEMPVLDGYCATREIRSLATTPIFLLTAHAFREAKDRAFAAGCTDHLTKPMKKATLLEAINKFVPSVDRVQEVDRIQVSVESWLKPVVGGYLEKRRGDVGTLRAALDRGDYATIRTLGHQMSGTGGGYGFEPITEIGSALEESALAADSTRIQAWIARLEQYLAAVRVE
jgi:signal transduction histidine kinase/CheY-like chemotaxis protein